MSEEKKEMNVGEMQEITKNIDKDSAWNGSEWMIPILMMAFGGLG